MTDEEFAHQLCAYLDPTCIIESAELLATKPVEALAAASLAFGGPELQHGNEGALADLVTKFLRGFRLPPAVLTLLEKVSAQPFRPEAMKWLADLRLAVSVTPLPRDQPQPRLPAQMILIVRERSIALDMVKRPIQMLHDMVIRMVREWRPLAEKKVSIMHYPQMPSAFFNYLDRRVGESLLTFEQQGDRTAYKMRYRASTIVGHWHAQPVDWEVARDTVRAHAATTFEPVWTKAR